MVCVISSSLSSLCLLKILRKIVFVGKVALKYSISTFLKLSIVYMVIQRHLALGGSVQCLEALGHFNCNVFIFETFLLNNLFIL
jgi:hypothetical protein